MNGRTVKMAISQLLMDLTAKVH